MVKIKVISRNYEGKITKTEELTSNEVINLDNSNSYKLDLLDSEISLENDNMNFESDNTNLENDNMNLESELLDNSNEVITNIDTPLINTDLITIINDKKSSKKNNPDFYRFNLPEKYVSDRKLTMYKINPSSKIKNDDILMVLNSFSYGYKEPFELMEDIDLKGGKLNVPRQNLLSFEMLVKKSSVDFNLVLDGKENNKETIINGLKYVWSESFFEETENDPIDEFIIKSDQVSGYDIKLKNLNAYMLRTEGRSPGPGSNGGYGSGASNMGIVKDILELSKILTEKDKLIWQICMQPAEKNWSKYASELLVEEKGKVKNTDKFKYGGCDVSIRLMILSEDKERSEILGNSFLMILKKLDGDNSLEGTLVKPRNTFDWLINDVKKRRVNVSMRFKKRNILSVKELEYFIKLPTKPLQLEYNLEVDEKSHMKIPSELLKNKGILIGKVKYKGYIRDICLDDSNKDDFMKSYCYVGSPRTGKDTSMINFIVEAAKKGHGAIIPDAINEMGNDRGMADSIRDALPKDRIIDISLDDYNFPVYFGLEDIMDLIGHNGINLMADNLIQILGLADNYASRKLTRLIAKACKCNLYDMYCFIRSPRYQQEILKRVMEEDELLGLELKHEFIEANVPANVKGAILSRLDEVMGNDLLKYMFAQEKNNKLDIKKWISEGKIIIIRMTKTEIGELGTQVLMYLLTLRIFWIKKMLNKDKDAKDKCVFLVFNEFFQYMSSSLESVLMQMIVECPKYRLGMLFAFHSPTPNQISKDFWETLKSSSLNYFLFKNTNEKVYSDMAQTLKPITSDMAMKTEKYESIFIPYVGGKQLEPFFMKMLMPPKERQKMFDNSNLTEEHKEKYGTHLKDVIGRVRDRELWMYRSDEEDEENANNELESEELVNEVLVIPEDNTVNSSNKRKNVGKKSVKNKK